MALRVIIILGRGLECLDSYFIQYDVTAENDIIIYELLIVSMRSFQKNLFLHGVHDP